LQRTLHRNDSCERSEAVSHLGMKIASVAKSAPSLLSLRAKQSPTQAWRLLLSQRTLHRCCHCKRSEAVYRPGMGVASVAKERSIATTARLLSLRAKQSPTRAERLLLSQRTLRRNDGMVIVAASEAKQSPAQAWRLLLSQRTLHRNGSSVIVAASEAVSHPSMEIASAAKSAPSQQQLGCCRCERSEAVSRPGMEIASVAKNAPSQ